jgi:uncharacterized membrane protein (UPF0127 family)
MEHNCHMPRIIQRIGRNVHLAKAKHARTFAQRFMGLMGVAEKDFDYALVFHLHEKGKLSASIHMLFMRMPIDVLFLDEQQRVVDAVKQLPTWVFNYTPRKEAKYVVELPPGTIEKYRVTLGGRVSW